jgi:hypothetical protein
MPFYRKAAAALAQIRFGGDTLIKILEAFSLGGPVVATRKGAEITGCIVESRYFT